MSSTQSLPLTVPNIHLTYKFQISHLNWNLARFHSYFLDGRAKKKKLFFFVECFQFSLIYILFVRKIKTILFCLKRRFKRILIRRQWQKNPNESNEPTLFKHPHFQLTTVLFKPLSLLKKNEILLIFYLKIYFLRTLFRF